MLLRNNNQKRKGQALLEYALLIAGVALISMAAVSLLGHKISDMIATVTVILPGAHSDDNNTIQSGHLIETNTVGTNGSIAVDLGAISTNKGTDRLGINAFGSGEGAANGVDGLIIESN